MQQIKIAKNENGSHDNQTVHGEVLDGYAVIPEAMGVDTLENYPFGEITVETIDGIPTVTSWTPLPIPEPEPGPEPEPTMEDIVKTMLGG